MDALHAGVAELVDALDLGSSDESCGGSSPSARTKRFQAFARRLPVDGFPQGILVRQTTGAMPSGRAPNILTISGPSRAARTRKKTTMQVTETLSEGLKH